MPTQRAVVESPWRFASSVFGLLAPTAKRHNYGIYRWGLASGEVLLRQVQAIRSKSSGIIWIRFRAMHSVNSGAE